MGARAKRRERPVGQGARRTVAGHWRRQWFPRLGRHKRVWIEPHTKGAADTPQR